MHVHMYFRKSMIYLCNWLERFLCLVYIHAVMAFALENQIMLMDIYANI